MNIWHVLLSYVFIPYPNPLSGLLEPILIVGWTLNYEAFFYIIFATMLPIPDKFRRFLSMQIFLIGLVLIGIITSPEKNTLASFYTSQVIAEFSCGIAVGYAYYRYRHIFNAPTALAVFLVIFGILTPIILDSFDVPDMPRLIERALPATAAVFGILCLDVKGKTFRSGFLLLLGDSSYSLYLVQAFCLSIAGSIGNRLHAFDSAHGTIIFIVASTITSILSGIIVHKMIERPMTSALRSIGRKTASRTVIGPAIVPPELSQRS